MMESLVSQTGLFLNFLSLKNVIILIKSSERASVEELHLIHFMSEVAGNDYRI